MRAGRILLVPGSGLGESTRDHTHIFRRHGVTRGQNESVATGRTLSGHQEDAQECGLYGVDWAEPGPS